MDANRDLAEEIEELRERLSRLAQASLRINESLDFDTVLQGVLDSARERLRGPGTGSSPCWTVRGTWRTCFSPGLPRTEVLSFQELPDGLRLFEYLSGLTEPLRVPDLLAHLRSLGLPDLEPPVPVGPAVPFLAAPVQHRGERVGSFFLAKTGIPDSESLEFSPEDEETLVLFASQAALVVSNARRFREEQQARSDLETLVNTSPVGVVVFDAGTGLPVSFNQEARRIVDVLREPDQSPEQLLDVLSVQRGDGKEFSLQEFPLAQLFGLGDTIRAEEIVMSVPGGRSVSVLVNATPIRSESGEVGSFVVTLQDLTDLEELEWLRAEFLAMVSHELQGTPHLHQGFHHHPAGGRHRPGRRRGGPVQPDHQLPDGPDAGDEQRPAGRGPHRDGHPVHRPGNPSRWPCWWRMPAAPF